MFYFLAISKYPPKKTLGYDGYVYFCNLTMKAYQKMLNQANHNQHPQRPQHPQVNFYMVVMIGGQK